MLALIRYPTWIEKKSLPHHVKLFIQSGGCDPFTILIGDVRTGLMNRPPMYILTCI